MDETELTPYRIHPSWSVRLCVPRWRVEMRRMLHHKEGGSLVSSEVGSSCQSRACGLPSNISDEQLVGAELYEILSLMAILRPASGPPTFN
jgi:hypothetical protein